MQLEQIIYTGNKIDASKALVMLHGRGSSAEDILSLANNLKVKDYLLVAPQATNHSWYPYSFLETPSKNEPWLSSALDLLNKVVLGIENRGITKDHIYFLGFSQGACLTLEYVARNATKYAGVVAFTGGLIGDKIYEDNYQGNFNGTSIFIGTSDPDPHVPVERVHTSVGILKEIGATVTEKVYPNMGHTITQDEINMANTIIFKS